MLFESAVEKYWEDKSRRLRGNTLEGYASAIRKHLAPVWTGREIEEYPDPNAQQAQEASGDRGPLPQTVGGMSLGYILMLGVVFLVSNIPTLIFGGIWLHFKNRRDLREDMKRMRIEDLG